MSNDTNTICSGNTACMHAWQVYTTMPIAAPYMHTIYNIASHFLFSNESCINGFMDSRIGYPFPQRSELFELNLMLACTPAAHTGNSGICVGIMQWHWWAWIILFICFCIHCTDYTFSSTTTMNYNHFNIAFMHWLHKSLTQVLMRILTWLRDLAASSAVIDVSSVITKGWKLFTSVNHLINCLKSIIRLPFPHKSLLPCRKPVPQQMIPSKLYQVLTKIDLFLTGWLFYTLGRSLSLLYVSVVMVTMHSELLCQPFVLCCCPLCYKISQVYIMHLYVYYKKLSLGHIDWQRSMHVACIYNLLHHANSWPTHAYGYIILLTKTKKIIKPCICPILYTYTHDLHLFKQAFYSNRGLLPAHDMNTLYGL